MSGVTGELDENSAQLRDGYLYITHDWKKGDTVRLELSMEPEFIAANNEVREDINKTALRRGPFIYCLEEADNGTDLHTISVYAAAKPETVMMNIAGTDVAALRIDGKKLINVCDSPDVDAETKTAPLYTTLKKPEYKDVKLTYVPYYAWNNRGEGEMSVWVNYIL